MIRLNPQSAGNHEHIEKWLEDLRNTTAPQVNGRLAAETNIGNVGYCCLGLGCVTAGIGMEEVDPEDPDDPAEFLFGTCDTLPPPSFHQWLGLSNEGGDDVEVDWPTNTEAYLSRPARGADGLEGLGKPMFWTCASLNDDCRLTFPQIADVIAYFGLRNG